ncbi:hypothetical protein D3C80_853210 [compost metagenome]
MRLGGEISHRLLELQKVGFQDCCFPQADGCLRIRREIGDYIDRNVKTCAPVVVFHSGEFRHPPHMFSLQGLDRRPQASVFRLQFDVIEFHQKITCLDLGAVGKRSRDNTAGDR